MPPRFDDKTLTSYLLGELSEAQQTRIEEQLFSDQECYERLQALKAEITDQCLRETLTPQQRDRFVQRFLSTRTGRDDALFARALDGVLREEETKRNAAEPEQMTQSWWRSLGMFFRSASGWQMAMTVGMIALVIGSAWLLVERHRLSRRLETAISERDAAQYGTQKVARLEEEMSRANSRNRELDQELQRMRKDLDQARQELEKIARQSKPDSTFGAMLSLVLAPGARRGNERVEQLVLTPQTRMVQLQLILESGETGTGYRAEVRTKDGTLIHSQDRLRTYRTTEGKTLRILIPAARLNDGRYEVSLAGSTPTGRSEIINYYDFSIARRF